MTLGGLPPGVGVNFPLGTRVNPIGVGLKGGAQECREEGHQEKGSVPHWGVYWVQETLLFFVNLFSVFNSKMFALPAQFCIILFQSQISLRSISPVTFCTTFERGKQTKIFGNFGKFGIFRNEAAQKRG